ncbi:unnamed protein product [Rhizoctonia solani]|uniref:Uncharacterized protein n=1 Tax=Rhizoctonia solani TaxID=456999 RepID=A0A8H3BT78_9AGAM|nr:unnamed protein product [Rhizoctonia solani]
MVVWEGVIHLYQICNYPHDGCPRNIHVLLSPVATTVLVVRTWLLWGGIKWVLIALIGGLVLSSVLSIYYISIDLQEFRIIPTVNPQLLPGCLFRISSTIWRPILFPFLYETFIVALTVTKVVSTPNRVPVVMRLFMDGTLYYVVIATVLLLTTIGAAYAPTRALVIGSGFHTACISVGCSRLFLSLHSWAHENKQRSAARSSRTRVDIYKHHSPNPSFSASSKGPAPNQSAYELVSRTAPDIEAGRVTTSIAAATSDAGATPLSFPQGEAPDVPSMLPHIERPSIPTRMWSNSPSVHVQGSQRSHRPPRSSSLYPVMRTTQGGGSVQPLTRPIEVEEDTRRKNGGFMFAALAAGWLVLKLYFFLPFNLNPSDS